MEDGALQLLFAHRSQHTRELGAGRVHGAHAVTRRELCGAVMSTVRMRTKKSSGEQNHASQGLPVVFPSTVLILPKPI